MHMGLSRDRNDVGHSPGLLTPSGHMLPLVCSAKVSNFDLPS